MTIVKVTYTTTAAYSGQNHLNIQRVMNDVRTLARPGINYNSCLCQDGKTFIHTAFFESEQDQQALNDLPSFKQFQQELKASGLEMPPRQELLKLVGSSSDIF